MVVIARNINDEMESYLDKRRSQERHARKVRSTDDGPMDEDSSSQNWFAGIFRKRIPDKVEENLPEEQATELEEMEHEMKEVDDEVEELEEKREGILGRFLKKMRGEKEMPEDLEDATPEIDPEVREVLKTLHKWLGKLSPGDLRAFKQSPDFAQYKALLEKYNLIKK